MFKNVIVGVDGRSGGRDAVALAHRLLDPRGRLTLVNVHLETTASSSMNSTPRPGPRPRRLLESEREAAGGTRDRQRRRDLGRCWAAPLRRGAGADLLVVGACRRGALCVGF